MILINNNICEMCIHSGLCKLQTKLGAFDEDRNLGIDITINNCENFIKIDFDEV